MAQDNQAMRYYATTYSQFSHNFLIATLTANDAQFQTEYLQTEETYSKFIIISNHDVYNKIKELANEKDIVRKQSTGKQFEFQPITLPTSDDN